MLTTWFMDNPYARTAAGNPCVVAHWKRAVGSEEVFETVFAQYETIFMYVCHKNHSFSLILELQ